MGPESAEGVAVSSPKGGLVKDRVRALEAVGGGEVCGYKGQEILPRRMSHGSFETIIRQKKRNLSFQGDNIAESSTRFHWNGEKVCSESTPSCRNVKTTGAVQRSMRLESETVGRLQPAQIGHNLNAREQSQNIVGLWNTGAAKTSNPMEEIDTTCISNVEMDGGIPSDTTHETEKADRVTSSSSRRLSVNDYVRVLETEGQKYFYSKGQMRRSYKLPDKTSGQNKSLSTDDGIGAVEAQGKMHFDIEIDDCKHKAWSEAVDTRTRGEVLSFGSEASRELPHSSHSLQGVDDPSLGIDTDVPKTEDCVRAIKKSPGLEQFSRDLVTTGEIALDPNKKAGRKWDRPPEAFLRTKFASKGQTMRQRRLSCEPLERKLVVKKRSQSVDMDVKSASRATRLNFGIESASLSLQELRQDVESSTERDITAGEFQTSNSLEATDGEPLESSDGTEEVSTSSMQLDSENETLLKFDFETVDRRVAYYGLGVETGARKVTPLTLGIATAGGVMKVLIPRNTSIPTKRENVFSTFVDNQTEVCIQIFEGERFRTMDNSLLGTFELSGIPPAPRGVVQITVSFDIDDHGILNVYVKDRSTGQKKQVTIVSENPRLSKEKIEEMIHDAEKNRFLDEDYKRKIDSKTSLEAYAYEVRNQIISVQVGPRLNSNDIEKVNDAVESVINWLHYKSWLFHCYNEFGETDEYDDKKNILMSICQPILAGIQQNFTAEVQCSVSFREDGVVESGTASETKGKIR